MRIRESNAEEKTAGKVHSGRVMDFVAKIACLIVAFFIWFYAMSTDVVNIEKDFTVPVTFTNESALTEKNGWTVLMGKESNIIVTLKGKRKTISKLLDSEIEAVVDVAGVESPGSQVLDIRVKAPTECEVINTSVSNIWVYIDRKITKKVPVKVLYTHDYISAGLDLSEPLTSFDEVEVSGPESELRNVVAAQAEFELGKITESVNATGRLALVDSTGAKVDNQYINIAQKTVNVSFTLSAQKDVPLTVGYKYGLFNKNNAKVTISPSFVTLKGEPSVINGIDKLEIAVVDEKAFKTDGSQSVPLEIPTGVVLVNATESTAVINVEHIGTVTKSIAVEKIEITDSGGLECELLTESLNIVFRGPSEVLQKLTQDNVTVKASLKNTTAGSGVNLIPVTVELSSEFENEVYELESYNVRVNVK